LTTVLNVKRNEVNKAQKLHGRHKFTECEFLPHCLSLTHTD